MPPELLYAALSSVAAAAGAYGAVRAELRALREEVSVLRGLINRAHDRIDNLHGVKR